MNIHVRKSVPVEYEGGKTQCDKTSYLALFYQWKIGYGEAYQE